MDGDRDRFSWKKGLSPGIGKTTYYLGGVVRTRKHPCEKKVITWKRGGCRGVENSIPANGSGELGGVKRRRSTHNKGRSNLSLRRNLQR